MGTGKARLQRWLRVAQEMWLLVAMCVLLVLGIEVLYRTLGSARRAMRRTAAPAHPYTDSTWYAAFAKEQDAVASLSWRPYVYFRRRPFDGEFINVDSAGYRVTWAPSRSTPASIEVFVLGGSTVFGSFQRDEYTVPSSLAKRFDAAGCRDITVRNLGESGYVTTQSVLELMLQLRAGARPEVVVMYDGINDVVAAVQQARAGVPQNEHNRARDFAFGRVAFSNSHTAAADIKALGAAAQVVLGRVQWITRIAGRPSDAVADADADSLAAGVISAYVANARVVESLAREYDFVPYYFWQPSLHTSRKPLTPFEAFQRQQLELSEFQRSIRGVHELVPLAMPSRMAQVAPGRFFSIHDIFDGEANAVFVDQIGHTSELGAQIVAGAIGSRIAEAARSGSGVRCAGLGTAKN